ncbi:hypothetical protein EV182_001239 [Spiromyces aspiralis]|uniref:Uncharacterized protein n=1 Tax=Spiromyces aspiralis TaxID=68401 RepID=A0ACC1HVR2_9FUNG|nr:hypothetical protein EV182_001239 [Spiromyces aspiralis]
MMVFVSNNDLPLNSLDKYHDCTFEDYERLVREIKAQPVGTPLPDPLPVAYFWLSQEFGYVQSQTLEVGRGCAYVYLKLLRSDSPFGNRDGNVISLRYIHLEGYYGPQSFPTVSLA